MKLTIENIQSYGSDLLFYVPSVHEITTLEKIHFKERIFSTLSQCKTESYWSDDYILNPILRKLDLTKKIKIDGVEVVPLIELAKIAFTHEYWKYYGQCYSDRDRVFSFRCNSFTAATHGFINDVPNQLQLFQWLFKHKFDLNGLIEKGLAVDASTLDINPYDN